MYNTLQVELAHEEIPMLFFNTEGMPEDLLDKIENNDEKTIQELEDYVHTKYGASVIDYELVDGDGWEEDGWKRPFKIFVQQEMNNNTKQEENCQ